MAGTDSTAALEAFVSDVRHNDPTSHEAPEVLAYRYYEALAENPATADHLGDLLADLFLRANGQASGLRMFGMTLHGQLRGLATSAAESERKADLLEEAVNQAEMNIDAAIGVLQLCMAEVDDSQVSVSVTSALPGAVTILRCAEASLRNGGG